MLHNTRRGGTAGQKLVARNFIATCLRLSLRRGQAETHCPEFQCVLASVHEYVAATRHTLPYFSPRLAFGCRFGAVRQKLIARYFTAACIRLTHQRGRTETHCPELQRVLASVYEYVAATRHTLPDFSPRLAFGCRFGAVKQKLIARNFNVCLLRCMSMSRLPVIRCPILHRALPSGDASAQSQPDANPFPLLSVACI